MSTRKNTTKGKKTDRKTRILNTAEDMFSKRGFEGVTLRQIASAADVDVALANYHFGRKRALFDAVLQRRAQILNTARNEALDAYLDKTIATGPDVGGIIEAYLRPLADIQASGDPGWKNYMALIAWVNSSSEWGDELMTQYFNPLVLRFISALKQALPDADEKAVYWGYHYLSGALTLTLAETGRIDQLSNGKAKASNIDAAYGHMIPFMTAGILGICTPPKL